MKVRLTQTHARNLLPGSVRFTCRDGEYRLAYTSGAIKAMAGEWLPTTEIYARIEASAYYSCNLSDIVGTGERMHDDYCQAIHDQKESN